MQVWPQFENLPHAIARAALSISAVSSTITGDLPPSSRVTEARCLAAAANLTLPTAGLPVKKTWSKGSSSSFVDKSASPSNAAISSGAKDSRIILVMSAEQAGLISDGFRIAGQPAAIADAKGPSSRLIG